MFCVCTCGCIWGLGKVSAAGASWQSHLQETIHCIGNIAMWIFVDELRNQSIGTFALSGAEKEQVVLWLQVLYLKGHPGQNERHSTVSHFSKFLQDQNVSSSQNLNTVPPIRTLTQPGIGQRETQYRLWYELLANPIRFKQITKLGIQLQFMGGYIAKQLLLATAQINISRKGRK